MVTMMGRLEVGSMTRCWRVPSVTLVLLESGSFRTAYVVALIGTALVRYSSAGRETRSSWWDADMAWMSPG